ncbi:hydrogenase large subunit [Magnetospirillum molischianum]|uniref:Ni,Fe-hydrogenase III large subunit n=1 Tax=Magnetospirillum molischianum DSM 120 TaxID=1150626 RepID=H8FUP8_MAGML|nr:hydrogenase expression protein HypE [Magnetospirillum molischianum]CCG42086.1 Ni,Fe-hydrogenase III large subunit [Magnetospirillum molischianum DSM 120]
MIGQDSLVAFLAEAETVEGSHPYPRVRLDRVGWQSLVARLAGSEWCLMAEWGEQDEVHVALRDEREGDIRIVSHRCVDRRFVAIGTVRPAAIRLERAIRDLWGLEPEGLDDRRPWFDHGRWPSRQPLAARPRDPSPTPFAYPFLPAEGEGLHQIPVGPVHAGVIEPGHFRFHAQGETVVRLEARLGYTHKGISGLAAGRTVEAVARLAGRISGDSTVAYALAFARAVEAATGAEVPRRADWLRALMAEMERLSNHLIDIGGICNDAAFAVMLAHMSVLRERILGVNRALFGHRLLMDQVVPGGVVADLPPEGSETIKQLLYELHKEIERARQLYENTPSLSDRTQGTGILPSALANRFGAGGVVGRASGRGHDARRVPGYPPYEMLDLAVPMLLEGDVNARVMIRFAEAAESLRLINRILLELPDGPVRADLPRRAGEGMALVESFRGEVLVWGRVDAEGRVVRLHAHDPSWFQWPLLEVAIKGNIVADFPLCNKSFNCSYSGHDQ